MHPKDPVTGNRTELVYGVPLTILKTTPEKQDASWTFLDWFLSKDIHTRWCIQSGYLPVRQDIQETAPYQEYLAGPGKQMTAFLDSFQYGVYMQGREQMPNHSAIRNMFNDEAWDYVMLGMASPEEALDRCEKAMLEEPDLFRTIG